MSQQVNETKQIAAFLLKEIDRLIDRPVRIMEVCGTHTVSIFRAGIRQLLPEKVELVSGPGCPVCVTPNDYLDTAIAYARQEDVIITTFGDMLKVPGTSSSLNQVKAEGRDIKYCAACWQNSKKLMPYVDSIGGAKQCSNCHNFIH